MSVVNYYRLKCLTENQFKYSWNIIKPTYCPTNSEHQIDNNSITKLSSVSSDIVEIKEESIATGGNYKSETVIININPHETSIKEKSWIIPINLFAVHFTTSSQHEGDNLIVDFAPDTIIGTITNDINIDDNIIHVDDNVLNNIYVGYYVEVDDLTNSEDCGMVISIDKASKTITVNNNISKSFLSTSPTYIRQTIRMIENFELGPPSKYSLGTTTIGGTYIPTGTVARIKYINNSSNAKKFLINVEYLY